MTRKVIGRVSGCVFGLVAAAWAVAVAADPNPATTPAPRPDKGWTTRHESFVAKAKGGGVDVLFLGDSITAGWENAGKDVWKERYAPLKAANFGIGGDRTQHVLWRITEGKELEGINPKAAVLMIGTNNTGTDTAEQIAEGVAAIVTELRKQRPKMKVLLLGVFPRSEKPGRDIKADVVPAGDLQPKIKAINERLEKLADGKSVVYLDIGKQFLSSDGGLSKDVMPDFLHLSSKGYAIWADAIQKSLSGLLKE